MGQVNASEARYIAPFNGAVEIGLRALTVLTAAFPAFYSIQRLVVFDYLLVHSDDVSDGPAGLHPKTPHRGAELLVRRGVLQEGIRLYQNRGLVEARYEDAGVYYSATENSAAFLDVLASAYLIALRDRADWVIRRFGANTDGEIQRLANQHAGEWGAEFAMESVLRQEENE